MSTPTKTTFHDLELAIIAPDPNQPRKTFDDVAMDELINSVREQGVLQPILVRPDADGFMIVAGERRYRAALAVAAAFSGRNTIPAIIRNLSDEEALEIQITENLIRKDVHPLEEGIAFAKLHERFTIEQIANRVGKSPSFVAKRIKLADLIEDGQKIYFNGHMDLEDAMKICRLSPSAQEEIIKEACPGDWRTRLGKNWSIGNITYYVRQNLERIDNANFDAEDASLYPEAGACSKCPHNSGNQPLLFDDLKESNCLKPSCFAIKEQRFYKRRLEELATNPKMLAVAPYASSNADKRKLEEAKQMGINVIEDNQYNRHWEPDESFPDFETWACDEYGDDWREDEDLDEKEARDEYNELLQDWKKEIDQHQEGLRNGSIVKATIIAGSDLGREIFVKLNPNAAAVVKATVAGGNAEEIAASAEIASLEVKEVRNKQLDGEKVWSGVRQLLNTDDAKIRIYSNNAGLSKAERKALFLAMVDKLDYSTKRIVKEVFGEDYEEKDFFTEGMLMQMSRIFMLDVMATGFGSHLTKGGKNSVAYPVIKSYFVDEVNQIELAQMEKAEARNERLQKRIAAIRASVAKNEPDDVGVDDDLTLADQGFPPAQQISGELSENIVNAFKKGQKQKKSKDG